MDLLMENYEHSVYKYVSNEKEADALAWAFVNENKIVKFPFKFPELKPLEIRANVLFTGLCHSDIAYGKSEWTKPIYPVTPGHEIIAEVSQIGSEVKDFKVGQRVGFGPIRHCCGYCKYCSKGKDTLCINTNRNEKVTYGTYWGGWATQVQQPAEFFFRLPDNIDQRKASPIMCAACTVYGPIKLFTNEGDKCGVVGIGGLGHLAVKFLAKKGFNVTAFTHSEEKKSDILQLGAKEVILLNDKEQLKQNENKFDFIINTLPSTEYFNETLNLLSPEGKYVMVGIPKFKEELKINFEKWIFGDILLIGSLTGSRKLTNEVLNYCTENNIYPDIEEFSFDDLPQAIDRIENCKVKFRCVVNVEEFSKNNGWFR